MVNYIYRASKRPDRAGKCTVRRVDHALQQALYQRALRQSLRDIPRYPLHEMSEFESVIFEHGNRFIPGITHDRAEFIRHRNRYIFFRKLIERDRGNLLKCLFSSPPRIIILDLGCGVGHGCATLATLPNCLILGIDNSPESIEYASLYYNRPNVEYRDADILQFVEDMSEYDYIVSSHVLEHIENGFSILPKLKFKKKLLIATPYDEPPGNPHHVLLHIKEYVYTVFPNKRIYYDDFWGRIHSHKISSRPCGLICIISK